MKVELMLNKPFLCQLFSFSIRTCCLVTRSVQILYGNYTAMSIVLRAVGVSNPGQGVQYLCSYSCDDAER